jgi:hypothetical protein
MFHETSQQPILPPTDTMYLLGILKAWMETQ